MKIFKKILNVFLSLVLLVVSFMIPFNNRVKAKTLGELKQELKEQEEYYVKLRDQKEATIEERAQIQEEIKANEEKIMTLKNESLKLEEEIAELNKSIESRYNEIKRIINYQQVSSGESAYLEYIFGAKTFTSFIYRASVSEQLSKYNKELIDGYESDIKKAEEKQQEIEDKREEIANIQVTLSLQYTILGEEIVNLSDDMSTAEENAKLLRANILDLQNTYGCSDDEDIDECKQKAIAANYIPPSTGDFMRPINNAVVTSDFGWYDPWENGNWRWHPAMDLASYSRAPIYAAADGKVVEVYNQYCGNWIVFIVHNINGIRYTTGYFHMSSVNVKEGDIVTAYTQIGNQGGQPWEDSCSTGEHLDFMITRGAYKMDYFDYPRNRGEDPRNYIYFPPLYGAYWYER